MLFQQSTVLIPEGSSPVMLFLALYVFRHG